jgi:hypothetical protein
VVKCSKLLQCSDFFGSFFIVLYMVVCFVYVCLILYVAYPYCYVCVLIDKYTLFCIFFGN